MPEIKLSSNVSVFVDEEDCEKVIEKKWYLHKGYAAKNRYVKGKKVGTIFLHHFILGTNPSEYVVDHINRNRLDNRKINLRVITQQQNSFNRGPNKNKKSSKFKGVYWSKEKELWVSFVKINGVMNHVGYFISETEAAAAYNAKAKELFGLYAWLNEVPEDTKWWRKRVFTRKGSSSYRGVTEQRKGRWQARLTVNGKRTSLGYYSSPLEAAEAYNEAAIKYLGEKALLNEIKE